MPPHVHHIDDEDDLQLSASSSSGGGSASSKGNGDRVDVTRALQHIDTGLFHALAIGILGIANASDSVEVLCIGFILPSIETEWSITGPEQGILSAAVFAGMLVGGFFGGSLSDLIGRKKALALSLFLNAAFAFLAALSPGLAVLCICRTVAGLGVGASVPPVFSLAAELLPRQKIGFWLSIIAWAWTGGMVIVAAMAWVIMGWLQMTWRVFAAAAALPALLAGVLLLALVPESPRWLNNKGRFKEAAECLTVMARWNARGEGRRFLFGYFFCSGRDYNTHQAAKARNAGLAAAAAAEQTSQLPPMFPIAGLPSPSLAPSASSSASGGAGTVVLTAADDTALTSAAGGPGPASGVSISYYLCSPPCRAQTSQGAATTIAAIQELFTTTSNLRRATVSMLVVWLSLSLGWYGLAVWIPSLYSQAGIEGSLYEDAFIAAASNIPGNLLASLVLDRFDRRKLLSLSMLVTTAMFVLLAVVKSEGGVIATTSVLNAVSVTSWASLNVLSAEAFPTRSRSTAMGLLSATGRLGSIIGQLLFGHLLKASAVALLLLVASLLLAGAGFAMWYPKLQDHLPTTLPPQLPGSVASEPLSLSKASTGSVAGGGGGLAFTGGGGASTKSNALSDDAFLLADAGGPASAADIDVIIRTEVDASSAAYSPYQRLSADGASGGSNGSCGNIPAAPLPPSLSSPASTMVALAGSGAFVPARVGESMPLKASGPTNGSRGSPTGTNGSASPVLNPW